MRGKTHHRAAAIGAALALAGALGAALGLWPAARAQQGAAAEYAVKAGMTYNLAKFVRWPDAARTNAGVLCVMGDNPFGDSLAAAVAGRTILEAPVEIRSLAAPADASSCLILFISRSERTRFREILNRVKSLPILTVSDIDGFAAAGGIVGFVMDGDRVALEVNQTATRSNGLSVSARLLRLAKVY